ACDRLYWQQVESFDSQAHFQKQLRQRLRKSGTVQPNTHSSLLVSIDSETSTQRVYPECAHGGTNVIVAPALGCPAEHRYRSLVRPFRFCDPFFAIVIYPPSWTTSISPLNSLKSTNTGST